MSLDRRLTRLGRVFVVLCLFPLLAFAVTQDHGARVLWVSADQSVFEVSPVDGIPALELASLPNVQALSVDQRTDQAWLYSQKHLWSFDASGTPLVNQAMPNNFHGGAPAGMAVDSTGGNVWIAIQGELYRLDLQGNLQTTIDLSRNAQALALDVSRSHLWVAEQTSLAVLDKTGATLFTVPLSAKQAPLALTYDAHLDQVWVLFKDALSRYDASGNEVFSIGLAKGSEQLNRLAPDGQGNLWAASNTNLSYIDQSGAVQFTVSPLSASSGQSSTDQIIDLVADPLNHTAWVAGDRYLEQVGTDSTVLQTVDSRDWTGSNVQPTDQGIHHAVLYVDTIPPVVSISAPKDGVYTNQNRVQLLLSYSDIGSGVDSARTQVTTSDGTVLPVTCVADKTNVGATCTLDSALPDSHYTLTVTVDDYAGNVSKPATVSLTIDTVPPTLTLTSPSGLYTNQPNFTLAGSMSEAGNLAINGNAVALDANNGFTDTVKLFEGPNPLTFTATDLAGNITNVTKTLILDTVPPSVPDLGLISVSELVNGNVTVTGKPGAMDPGVTITIKNLRTGQTVTTTVATDGSFSVSIAAVSSDQLAIGATDEAGNVTNSPTPIDVSNLPPDPSDVAPQLDNTIFTGFSASTNFLYAGSNPIQTGVAAGTIKPSQAAVIKGRVLDQDGNALPGVTVTVLDHPEFGQTLSRDDGRFDLAVNGGGLVTLKYTLKNHLSAERQIQTPWQDFAHVDDVVLIKPDSNVTDVLFGNSNLIQVARGSVEFDQDGSRQATLLFMPGTTATMTLLDGSTKPLTSAHVRATEFTVGSLGPSSMPGELPANSGYTYAVDYSIDESVAAGAATVTFNHPVISYLDNFLHLKAGTAVPVGWYDSAKGVWVPTENGNVIKILSVDVDGAAQIDVTGSGKPADAAVLTNYGITQEELVELAKLYPVGKSLWRMEIPHFTPYDFNFALYPPSDAVAPKVETNNSDPADLCQLPGCIIDAQTQTLRQKIDVIGTPYSLYYSSRRVPGNRDYSLNIRLSGDSLPSDLKSIKLKIEIAGQMFTQTFAPVANQNFTYIWNGKDVYGRTVYGTQDATISIGYQYSGYIEVTPRFGFNGNSSTTLVDDNNVGQPLSRQLVTIWTVGHRYLGAPVPADFGAGGWALNVHHVYDPGHNVLYLGDGQIINDQTLNAISTSAGSGLIGFYGDGGSALSAKFHYPTDVVAAPNGSRYIADYGNRRIRQVDTDGVIRTVAGNGYTGYLCNTEDGVQAVNACLDNPAGIALGPDGTLYIIDDSRIRHIETDGIISTVAGQLTGGFGGDGGPATAALLEQPQGIAVGPDGSLYIADTSNNRVRRVGPDGIITTIAGTGRAGYGGDGGPATAAYLDHPEGMAVGPDGSLYLADTFNHRLRRVGPDGNISTVAGNGAFGYCATHGQASGDGDLATKACLYQPTGVAVAPDGRIFIADSGNHRIREIGTDGNIITVAGGNGGFCGDSGPANLACLNTPKAISIAPNGDLFIADYWNQRIRKVSHPDSPGSVASQDGNQLYIFDDKGHHIKTLDAVTGATLYSFAYTGDGRLTSIADRDGNITHILRDSNGNPTAIISPNGQTTDLTVGPFGYLSSITNPAGNIYKMQYPASGLMTQFEDPNGNVDKFTYDSQGALTKTLDETGGGWSIARENNGASYITTLTSGAGQIYKYEVDALSDGSQRDINTLPDGLTNTALNESDGTKVNTYQDGTVTEIHSLPDPRFGLTASFAGSTTITTPSGLTSTITESRTAPLGDQGDLFSFASLSDSVTVNGSTFVSSYAPDNNTWTEVTPVGRKVTTVVDALDRPISRQIGGLAQMSYDYSAEGSIQNVMVGTGSDARTTQYRYYTSGASKGYLQSVTDSLNRTISYQYDSAGRVTRQSLPDGQVIQYGYDASGNLTSFTPPSRPAHNFNYDGVNKTLGYTPPALSGVTDPATHYTYNLDKQLTRVTRPDGKVVNLDYDSAGRLSTVIIPTGTYQYNYSNVVGRVSNITAPDNETLSYTWDGFLNTASSWTGAINGNVTRTFNKNFEVSALSVDNVAIINFYDGDGLLVGAGDEALIRDANSGLLSGTKLGNLTTSIGRNVFGEPTSDTVSYAGNGVFNVTYVRDAVGRITSKTEAENGNTVTWGYGYNKEGMLDSITQNGVTLATYGYDANGNRTTLNGQTIATYDDQDRLLNYGQNSYTYTANGELLSKATLAGTTHYIYDVMGNLLEVKLQNGKDIQYVIDGQNRRIGKIVDGKLSVGFLYKNQLNPVAELDGNGNVIERYVYGTRQNVPDYIIKDGSTYRVVTDQLGSPRMIADTATGNIVEQIDYDAWGNVTRDTNPSFQPFGFAGGLYDPDTKLVRFGARDYDPETGRWTAKDALLFGGGDSDLYGYAGNDPINMRDPSGHDPLGAVIGAVAGGIVGYINGRINGDSGDALRNDVLSGVASGALIGLTDGASLLAYGVRAGESAGVEALKEYANKGCVSGSELAKAALLSAFGDAAGSAAADAQALKATDALHMTVDADPAVKLAVGTIAASSADVGMTAVATAGKH